MTGTVENSSESPVGSVRRGDGVGIEVTASLCRGVRLEAGRPGRIVVAAEVAIEGTDDAALADALLRLHAELGRPSSAARVATFPASSWLSRADVTGRSGPELNELRHLLDTERSISSTILADDGPRRWMLAVGWDGRWTRRLEALAERAGFVDATVEPSPVPLARVLPPGTSGVERVASVGEAFEMVVDNGVVAAAVSVDAIGRQPPSLRTTSIPIARGLFDEIDDAEAIASVIRRVTGLDASGDSRTPVEAPPVVHCGTVPVPDFPPEDLRAPERQCVALGAAVGAAGLSGRLRPVDILLPTVSTFSEGDRPWAVERVSAISDAAEAPAVGEITRALSRFIPRRRRPR